MQNFKEISYLKSGNRKQQLAYCELSGIRLFDKLADYNPVLCGTIPIGIDIENSDLDIICTVDDLQLFENKLIGFFGEMDNFSIEIKPKEGIQTVICRFTIPNFEVEIFGQNVPVEQQNAYKHLLIEAQILEQKGEPFRKEITLLKRQGFKTEPAFAKLLGLNGNAYLALLEYFKDDK